MVSRMVSLTARERELGGELNSLELGGESDSLELGGESNSLELDGESDSLEPDGESDSLLLGLASLGGYGIEVSSPY